jgi:hypothetical protein
MPRKTEFDYQSIQSTQVYLNSATADIYLNSSKKSNVAFMFKNAITLDKNAIEMKVSMVNAQIPISWYLVNDTNNQIIITIAGVATTYSFKTGNYNINTFMTEWTNSIGAGWTLTFDTIKNKISFSYTTNFIFSDNDISIFNIIGFQKKNIYSSTNNTIVADFVCNFAGITRLNIKSSCFNLHNIDSNNKGLNRILAVIPVSSLNSGYIFYNNFTNYKDNFKGTNELASMEIEIMDDFEQFIDFNGVDWSMTLQIDVLSEVIQAIDTLHDVYEKATEEFI